MRALLVGCGSMANVWLEAITANPLVRGRVEIVGLVDSDEVAARALADTKALADMPVYGSVGEALGQVKCDIVFDVTPPEARADIVRQALAQGCHVLSEKPMANNMADARELTQLAAKANRMFAVTQNRRYKEGVRRIGSFLRSGALGEVTGLHADFFLGAHFGGFRDQMDHVLLLDMAIHHFDAARYISGQNARTVFCLETNPKGSWYRHGASAFATFEMGQGCIFTYRGSWCAEGKRTSWDAAWRITGERGSLTWDGLDRMEAHVAADEDAFLRTPTAVDIPAVPSTRDTQDHASVISAFLDALDTGTPPETACTDNLHSMAMVFGAIDSARTGKLTTIEQDFGRT